MTTDGADEKGEVQKQSVTFLQCLKELVCMVGKKEGKSLSTTLFNTIFIETFPCHQSMKTAEIASNYSKSIMSLVYLPNEAALSQISMDLVVLSWMGRFCRLGGFWNLRAAAHRAK